VLHRAPLCTHVLETLGFRVTRSARGLVELEREGEVIVLPESGAVSNGIIDRLAEAAGIDSEAFLGLLARQSA
jgi:hypothetical protein